MKPMFDPGYYITAELRVKNPSRVREAKQALTALCAATLKEEGGSIFTLHQDAEDSARFLLWERFDDENAFKRHFEEPHTRAYVALDLTEVVRFYKTGVVHA